MKAALVLFFSAMLALACLVGTAAAMDPLDPNDALDDPEPDEEPVVVGEEAGESGHAEDHQAHPDDFAAPVAVG